MFRRIMTEIDIEKAYRAVLERVANASKARPPELQGHTPRLVAVSKTKPLSLVKQVYNYGQRNFGENYVQELVEKSSDFELLKDCGSIRWHFIGHLQRNKVSKVLNVPNLYMVETIDNQRLAASVNATWERLQKSDRLKVMVQVNTSGEENKHGCKPEEASDLFDYVMKSCPKLEVIGLMTIGVFDYDLSKGPNPDFECLIQCRKDVCEKLGLNIEDLELSMGMSNDFEHAIMVGSTNVRVGSTIFGSREIKKKGGDGDSAATDSTSNNPLKHVQSAPQLSNMDQTAQRLASLKIKPT